MTENTKTKAFRIQASVLRAALGDVLGAVEAKNIILVLAHVMIEVADGVLSLTATNLDIQVTRTCATADRDGPGSADWIASICKFATTVQAKPLAAIVAEFEGEAMVTLELIDSKLQVKAGRARFRLHTLPITDFPVMVSAAAMAHAFELGCSVLGDAFARVEYAISTEETRYYLNGIYVHVAQDAGAPQYLVLATTDGHRLARLRGEVPEGAAAFPAAIWPRQAVALLDKLLKVAGKTGADNEPSPKVLVEANEAATMLRFTMPAADGGEITLLTKVIDGNYPDYSRVIPASPALSLVVDRAALAQAVKRVGVLADKNSRAVRAEIRADAIELVVTTADVGEAREELPCVFDGEPVAIGLNGQYWREALLALACDEVTLAFNDAASPVLLRAAGAGVEPETLVQVLMPMRV